MTSIFEIEQILSRLSVGKLSELFQMADGLMLTGSYASNTINENSDIDIIVLSKNINYVYSETTNSSSKCIQLIFLPYFKFQNIVLDDKYRGEGLYASMIRNGIIWKDTESLILTKTKRYILNTFKEHRSDQLDYALVHQIISTLDVIKYSGSSNEKIFCASELLLNVTRLVLGKYTDDAKHLARLMPDQDIAITILDSFRQFIETDNPSKFIHEIEEVISFYGSHLHNYTTGWVFTYPYNKHIIVFSPSQSGYDNHYQKYLIEIKTIFSDCLIYGFYEGRNQIMEEGYYIYIYSDITPIEVILTRLNNYKRRIIKEALKYGILYSFPYKSLFHEGLSFGGKELFNHLVRFYSELWGKYLSLSMINSEEGRRNISKILATDYFLKLNRMSDILQCGFFEFMSHIYDILILEAVDPNGLYNMIQMDIMKKETLERYLKKYHVSEITYKNIVNDIEENRLLELEDLNQTFNALFEFIRNVKENEILMPDIYPVRNKKDMLIVNISIHIMSILQLAPHDKFSIVFNYLQYKNHDI